MRSALEKYRVATLLNNERFELVSNHCLPATEHLARIGVQRSKLIAWDIRHPFAPSSYPQKHLVGGPKFKLFYVGSIVEDKGVTDLVHAVALLRKRGFEVHCSLAGAGDIDIMTALAHRLGVFDLISFLGLVGNNEIFELMRESDLVAIPSRTYYPEGFPLVVFEAIASRTPIVCSDHPMFRTVLIDGRTASVFPAGNCNLFADAIERTLSDSNLYAKLSAAALSSWEALKGPADWRTMLTKWVAEGASSPWIQQHKLEVQGSGQKKLTDGLFPGNNRREPLEVGQYQESRKLSNEVPIPRLERAHSNRPISISNPRVKNKSCTANENRSRSCPNKTGT